MIIYKVTNLVNNKIYIGKTIKKLQERRKQHLYNLNKVNCAFYNAIKKHGIQNFKWEILEECETQEQLNEMEFHYIKQYNSYKNFGWGYNLTLGGDGGNINEFHPNKNEIYKKVSNSNKGKYHYLNKFSETEKNQWLDQYRRGKNNPMYGKTHTDERKLEASEHTKGENNPFYGRHHDEKTKEKMSKNGKGKNLKEKNCNYNKKGEENHNSKKYLLIYPSGEQEIIKGIVNFCYQYNKNVSKKDQIYPQCLIQVAKGRYKQHKGFKMILLN